MYFIANWKMFGEQKSLNSLNKVIKFSKINKNNKFKLIYCPPYTLLDLFYKKLKILILMLVHKIVMKMKVMVLTQVQ